MDVFDIIVTVLVLAGSAVFEASRKKKGKAVRPEKELSQEPESDVIDWMPEVESEVLEWMPVPESVPDNHQVVNPLNDSVSVAEPVRKASPSVKRSSPVVVEENNEADKERIDARKLVIYSEIMKTKF